MTETDLPIRMQEAHSTMRPVENLRPHPQNPREDLRLTDDFVGSIKRAGVLQPLLVTKLEDGVSTVIIGHRRLAGAEAAGAPSVPVRSVDVSDDEALDIMLMENTQRDDLTPLEEARVYKLLLANADLESVAARVSRPASYVRNRLRLNELIDQLQDMLIAKKLNLGGAMAFAAAPREVQASALPQVDDLLDTDVIGSGIAQWAIERATKDLSRAPFDVTDLIGSEIGCNSCPKRTGAQPNLFVVEEGLGNCLDSDCWQRKTKLSAEQRIADAKARGQEVIDGDGVVRFGRPNYDSGFIAADKQVDELADVGPEPEDRWGDEWDAWNAEVRAKAPEAKDVLDETKVVVAVDSEGRAVELVRKEDVAALLKERGKDTSFYDSEEQRRANRKNEQAKDRAKERLMAKVREAQVDAVVTSIESLSAVDELVGHLVRGFIEAARHDQVSAVLKRREVEFNGASNAREKLLEHVAEMKLAQAVAVCCELSMHGGYSNEGLVELAKRQGVDLKRIEIAVKAAEKKPAKAKAKQSRKKSAKKATKKKPSTKPEKVLEVGLKKDEGWLYYLDEDCNIARKSMKRKGSGGEAEVIVETAIEREEGFLYFIDRQGDLSRSSLRRPS